MPIELGIWRMGEKPERIEVSSMDKEEQLETLLASDLSILDPNLLLIGRQVKTAYNTFIDLLAINPEGNLVVIELKRDRTPREVVAQVLDYGSWVNGLEDDDIAGVFETYLEKYDKANAGMSLDDAFCQKFDVKEMPEALNESHELVVVAASLDDSTERIISYLMGFGLSVNAAFFRLFKDNGSEYLSRAWLVEPDRTDIDVPKSRDAKWNGEYYVSFGHDERRQWGDARKYGFISGGGKAWYSKTLGMLSPGDRVWVNIPKQGYVGVGLVTEPAVPVDKFTVKDDSGNDVPITCVPLDASNMHAPNEPEDEKEHLVRVEWVKAVAYEDAVKEKGFFGNQNTVARPTAKAWRHTIDRLKMRFGIAE